MTGPVRDGAGDAVRDGAGGRGGAAHPGGASGSVSPVGSERGASPRVSRLRHLRARLASGIIPFAGLVLLWMLLWGQFTWLAFVTGIILAGIISTVFYLPAVRLSGHFHPLRGLVFLLRLLADIISASLQVAWTAIGPGYRASNAVVAVQLRTRSDLIMTFTAVTVGIVPGSIVLDIDREHAILYLHALNVHDGAGVEAVRRTVLGTEQRLIQTVGTVDDRQRLAGHPSVSAGEADDTRVDPRGGTRADPQDGRRDDRGGGAA